jgi:hypothetical protein
MKCNNLSWLILLVFLFIFTSCGYRFGEGAITKQYSTFTVPYIRGDADGILTAKIIKQMSLCAGLCYNRLDGDLILAIELVEVDDQNIGFRYDRNRKGQILKSRSIIPTETRTTIWANVKVIEGATNRVLLEPVVISASLDFDHDYYSSRNEINIFSLGQLNDYDVAHDVAYRPLFDVLAQKIVDYLCASWQ